MFFFITIACSMAVWWMFHGRGAVDSPWLLGYGMFVMFIGQGVDFSRKNRLVLTILLQLIIVMVWILCNAYEGVITSFMIQPLQENRLETFEQLIASDYEIIADQAFLYSINETAAYDKLKSRLMITKYEKWGALRVMMQKLQKVVILECDQTELIMSFHFENGDNVSDHYYQLPTKLSSYLIRLEASYFNPFIERLQHYMDLSFQAGLMHIWNVFMSHKHLEKNHNDEPTYLKLEDLTQVFSILVIGYVLSTLVLLFEIFFHDTLKRLELANLARRLRNRVNQMAYKKKKQPKHPEYQKGALYYIIHRRKRVKRLQHKKLKVRRIYVQPRFPVN
jgi:signal transduction histidine kinase